MRLGATLQPDMEPYPGYRLLKPLGMGAFAEVWASTSPDGDVVALKFLTVEHKLSTPLEVRALQAVRQVEHPNLLRIHRVWCQPEYIVIAMERAEASLLDLLDIYQTELGMPMMPEHVCELLLQAGDVLDFLNARRHRLNGHLTSIQHRDVKPSNLLLFGNTVKLSDYGTAALLSGPQRQCAPAGTMAYSAPEVFQGRVTQRSDQFALAVTYCHLRTGKLPFTHHPDKFERGYVRPPPNLTLLDAEERPIVARALSPEPMARWPSCRAFLEPLARLHLTEVAR